MQINQTNIGAAIELLTRAFPTLRAEFWQRGLARLQGSSAHRVCGEDIGQLLYVDDQPVGIGLTAVSHQPDDGAGNPRRVVNLASWYIEPAHRWRLPMLLGKMLRDPKAVYTDLTPTPALWPLLDSLGFQPINQGVNAICIPAAAIYHMTSHAVIDWDQLDKKQIPDHLIEVFEEHRTYGCCLYAIKTPDKVVPILVKPCKLKGIPAAQIIYCDDNEVLIGAIGGLCRKLGRHGLLTLLIDISEHQQRRLSPVSVPIRSRRRRFIKNGHQLNRTDFTFSELVFFDY